MTPPNPPRPQTVMVVRDADRPCLELTVARSLRTQQRAYDPTSPHHPGPHGPPKGTAVLGAAAKLPAELVSVPPSSTTPTTRGPPESGNHHVLGAALDHHTHVAASAP